MNMHIYDGFPVFLKLLYRNSTFLMWFGVCMCSHQPVSYMLKWCVLNAVSRTVEARGRLSTVHCHVWVHCTQWRWVVTESWWHDLGRSGLLGSISLSLFLWLLTIKRNLIVNFVIIDD